MSLTCRLRHPLSAAYALYEKQTQTQYFFLLLGKAEPALIKSDQKGSEYDRFNLEWTARSLTTVEKFKVEYKTVSAKEWKSVEAEAFPLPTEENTYTGTGMISHLKPATVYLARVSSRNAYGFSKPSQAFKFATRGAGKNYYTLPSSCSFFFLMPVKLYDIVKFGHLYCDQISRLILTNSYEFLSIMINSNQF